MANDQLKNSWSDQTDKVWIFDIRNCGEFAFYTNILLNPSRRRSWYYTGLNFSIETRTFIFWWIDDACLCSGVRRWTDGIFGLVTNRHHICSQITTAYKRGSWLVLSCVKLFLTTHFHLRANKNLAWWSYFCVVNCFYFYS